MKQKYLQGGTLLISLFAVFLTSTTVLAGGNNWIHGNLRVDLPAVYNATKYDLRIKATGLPTTGIPRSTFTTAWLAVWLDDPNTANPRDLGFSQVGLMTFADGIHWFVYSMKGVSNCRGGDYLWGSLGCLGAVNDIVGLNQFHRVMLLKDSDGSWHARVYDTAGNYYDVAKIASTSNRIYLARADFEEGYGEPIDPEIAGKFYLYHPSYYSSGTTATDWPYSANATNQHNYLFLDKQVNNLATDPNPQCPTYYAATPDPGDIWFWYAGTGGVQCGHIFPPIAYDNGNAAVGYTGSWTFNNTCCPYAWKGTLNWSNVVNDKATLVTIPNYHPSSSITRLYTMAPNRGSSIVKNNGAIVAYSNDYASTKRYQVARTWGASGATTMDIINNCCNYTDVDAFLVDTPQVASGTYDNYHYMIRYIGGSWTHNSTTVPSAASGTLSWTNIAESAATFTFTGSRIDYYYTLAPNRGKAAITIDDVEKEIINACNATKAWQQSKSYTGLGAGTHTIHVANMGQSTCGDGSSTYQYIDVDKFQVYP